VSTSDTASDVRDAEIGMAWWNSISPLKRAWWCGVADSAAPCDAWAAFQPHEARECGEEVRRSA
jgi:hypothetical protein